MPLLEYYCKYIEEKDVDKEADEDVVGLHPLTAFQDIYESGKELLQKNRERLHALAGSVGKKVYSRVAAPLLAYLDCTITYSC